MCLPGEPVLISIRFDAKNDVGVVIGEAVALEVVDIAAGASVGTVAVE